MPRIAFLLSLFLLVLGNLAHAGDEPYASGPAPHLSGNEPPKREFRAVWVATVENLDFPLQTSTDSSSLKQQYLRLIKRYKELGLNAIIFQARPAADAFYPSRLAPWSAFLTGRQGLAPEGHFDPLAFFIREAHRNGMEFHAWLNPYRATINMDTANLARDHPFYRNPDWLVRYGNQFYFNPGMPEVQDHLLEVVEELVNGYDLDAIHFDDYFYPYRVEDKPFPDSVTYARYARQGVSLEDWRRENIDLLISRISARVKQLKPHVRLGISPFGVWRNADRDLAGSRTRAGITAFDDTYADVLKWMHSGWIDYIVPQLYWQIGHPAADYESLLNWWSRHLYGRQLYIGLALYKVDQRRDPAWNKPDEIPRQVSLTRSNGYSRGNVLFRSQFLFSNPLGLCDSLERLNRYPALLPEWPAPSSVGRPNPPELKRIKSNGKGLELRWESNGGDPPRYYAVYRFKGYAAPDFSDPANLVAVTPLLSGDREHTWVDEEVEDGMTYTYAVTALNRYHAESRASEAQRLIIHGSRIQRLRL